VLYYLLCTIIYTIYITLLYRYTTWLCRGIVSATTFTLVGVINKFLTVLLNVLIWDKHSTVFGIFAVCVCLLSGSFYQQAPRRDDTKCDTPPATDAISTETTTTTTTSNNNSKHSNFNTRDEQNDREIELRALLEEGKPAGDGSV
jgi:hypothetical protein